MPKKISNKLISDNLKKTALMMTVRCVRNTIIENYHAGMFPSSKTGDFSDVKVVTPFGEPFKPTYYRKRERTFYGILSSFVS